jgi:hypothetical protein
MENLMPILNLASLGFMVWWVYDTNKTLKVHDNALRVVLAVAELHRKKLERLEDEGEE